MSFMRVRERERFGMHQINKERLSKKIKRLLFYSHPKKGKTNKNTNYITPKVERREEQV